MALEFRSGQDRPRRVQQAGLLVERANARMADPERLTLDIARDVMLSMPFRKFEQRKFLLHDRQNLAFIRFAPSLWRQLKPADLSAIKSIRYQCLSVSTPSGTLSLCVIGCRVFAYSR